MRHDEILADFPELTEAHIRATLEFAALRERRLATPAWVVGQFDLGGG